MFLSLINKTGRKTNILTASISTIFTRVTQIIIKELILGHLQLDPMAFLRKSNI